MFCYFASMANGSNGSGFFQNDPALIYDDSLIGLWFHDIVT